MLIKKAYYRKKILEKDLKNLFLREVSMVENIFCDEELREGGHELQWIQEMRERISFCMLHEKWRWDMSAEQWMQKLTHFCFYFDVFW